MMIRTFVTLAILGLVVSKVSLSPLVVISSDSRTPTLLTLDEVLSYISQSGTPYHYYDISSSGPLEGNKPMLKQLISQTSPSTIKHMSLINDKEASRLQSALAKSAEDVVYTVDNVTEMGNKTGRFIADLESLTPKMFQRTPNQPMLIVNLHSNVVRLLQQTQTSGSAMLSVMTPSALSGLLVALFLLVMLSIAVKCLMDLKTNDRFPRNLLNVGKES